MKISTPFSTISYNTAAFLTATLQDLIDRRKIDFFAWVEHFPEDDETKKHKHVYIVPNGKIDTDQFREMFLEIDLQNPSKPLACMPCKKSKWGDWYLYGCHDKAYLASKGQTRRYHYDREDFIVSDQDYFTEEIHTIDHTKYNKFGKLKEAVDEGLTFKDLLATGIVPLQQTYAWEKAFSILAGCDDHTDRSGRTGHEVPSEPSETPSELDNVLGSIDRIADTKDQLGSPCEGRAWFDVHSSDGYVALDPDEGLPW